MNEEKNKNEVEMLEEYDFSQAVIGKYAKQYAEGTNIVVLEPDVAKSFRIPQLSIKPCGKLSSNDLGSPNRGIEQAVAPDASIAWLSRNFLASMLGWLSLGAGEQQRYAAC